MLRPGDILTNKKLSRLFQVGTQGGMRRSLKGNCLVVISDLTKGLYEDRWEGNILHYTGMGKSGDQKLNRQNRTLEESRSTRIPVHLFEVFTSGNYVYVGGVELAGNPYRETQIGDDGKRRKVYMFPMRLRSGSQRPTVSQEHINLIANTKQKLLSRKNLELLRELAKLAQPKPQKRNIVAQEIIRDAAVVAYVKRAAEGRCDLCGAEAPFRDKNGELYLECHHVKPLAEGGGDTISNAVALCPNCHRKMHALNKANDRRILLKRIRARESA